ncbi:MAG: PKD domain-containing protein, partial [Halobacteriales archaeon]|nr:PKD domain-containing protein [Halobacteriales archaeon]
MRPDLGARGSRHLSLAIVLLVGVLTIGVGTAPVVAGPTSIDQPVALQQANEPPVADFEYSPAEPEPGQPVVLNASASHDPDGEIVEYRWDLDDDGEVELEAGPNARVAFPRAGQYPVTLTVVDNDGQTASTTQTITVGGD